MTTGTKAEVPKVFSTRLGKKHRKIIDKWSNKKFSIAKVIRASLELYDDFRTKNTLN